VQRERACSPPRPGNCERRGALSVARFFDSDFPLSPFSFRCLFYLPACLSVCRDARSRQISAAPRTLLSSLLCSRAPASEKRLNEVSCAQFSRSMGARRADERNWKIHAGDAIRCRSWKRQLELAPKSRPNYESTSARELSVSCGTRSHVRRIVRTTKRSGNCFAAVDYRSPLVVVRREPLRGELLAEDARSLRI